MTGHNPYETPMSDSASEALTKLQLAQMASAQKRIIYALILNFVSIPLQNSIFLLAVILSFVALGLAATGLLRMAAVMQYSRPKRAMLLVAMLVPLANILVLLSVNSRATRQLREGGYQVGLLGASAKLD